MPSVTLNRPAWLSCSWRHRLGLTLSGAAPDEGNARRPRQYCPGRRGSPRRAAWRPGRARRPPNPAAGPGRRRRRQLGWPGRWRAWRAAVRGPGRTIGGAQRGQNEAWRIFMVICLLVGGCFQSGRVRGSGQPAFSAIMTVGALVLPPISVGMMDASATRAGRRCRARAVARPPPPSGRWRGPCGRCPRVVLGVGAAADVCGHAGGSSRRVGYSIGPRMPSKGWTPGCAAGAARPAAAAPGRARR